VPYLGGLQPEGLPIFSYQIHVTVIPTAALALRLRQLWQTTRGVEAFLKKTAIAYGGDPSKKGQILVVCNSSLF